MLICLTELLPVLTFATVIIDDHQCRLIYYVVDKVNYVYITINTCNI